MDGMGPLTSQSVAYTSSLSLSLPKIFVFVHDVDAADGAVFSSCTSSRRTFFVPRPALG